MTPGLDEDKVFIVHRGDLEFRVDPIAYHPDRQLAKKQIENMPFVQKPLRSAAQFLRLPSQGDQYIGLENIESGNGRLLSTGISDEMASGIGFVKNTILFPKLRPYLNKIWLADFSGSASTEFHVFAANMEIRPEFLAIFLRSSFVLRQTSRLMTGSTLPRLQTEEVKRLSIPIPHDYLQQRIIFDWRQAIGKMEKADQYASALLASIDDYLLSELGISLPPEPENTICNRIFTAQHKELSGDRFDPLYNNSYYSSLIHSLKNVNATPLRKFTSVITKGETPLWRGDDYQTVGINFLRAQNISPDGLIGEMLKIEPEVHERMRRSQLTKISESIVTQQYIDTRAA